MRFLAEGRDASATVDSALLDAPPGFTNDGDNEITGIHISDGDPTRRRPPRRQGSGALRGRATTTAAARHDGDGGPPWRVFFTQQHGDNHTWELVPRP